MKSILQELNSCEVRAYWPHLKVVESPRQGQVYGSRLFTIYNHHNSSSAVSGQRHTDPEKSRRRLPFYLLFYLSFRLLFYIIPCLLVS